MLSIEKQPKGISTPLALIALFWGVVILGLLIFNTFDHLFYKRIFNEDC